nr:hypothetical protein [Tanacetum cinerariifolium]
VANAARNYEILHKRDDDGAERPDKRQKSGVPVMGMTRETGVSSPTDLSILNTAASTSGQANKKPVHRVAFSLSLRIMLLRPQ